MRRTRLTMFTLGILLVILALVATIFVTRSTSQEETQIRARYQQMRTALTANDTNAAVTLVAPQHRKRFQLHGFSKLDNFALPLGPRSSVLILGDKAEVWPERTSHYLILPGGNAIEMIRTNGDWFFTGDIHID